MQQRSDRASGSGSPASRRWAWRQGRLQNTRKWARCGECTGACLPQGSYAQEGMVGLQRRAKRVGGACAPVEGVGRVDGLQPDGGEGAGEEGLVTGARGPLPRAEDRLVHQQQLGACRGGVGQDEAQVVVPPPDAHARHHGLHGQLQLSGAQVLARVVHQQVHTAVVREDQHEPDQGWGAPRRWPDATVLLQPSGQPAPDLLQPGPLGIPRAHYHLRRLHLCCCRCAEGARAIRENLFSETRREPCETPVALLLFKRWTTCVSLTS